MLVRKIAVARFCRTLSTLTASGVPILDGLEITAKTSGNAIIEDAIMAVRKAVEEGKTISAPLAETKVFPPMVVQMINVGEQTGALDQMLNEDRRLLRGRGGHRGRRADEAHRAAHDRRSRRHHRHHRDRDVPADVRDPAEDRVTPPPAGESAVSGTGTHEAKSALPARLRAMPCGRATRAPTRQLARRSTG
jgi:hypothetical protein